MKINYKRNFTDLSLRLQKWKVQLGKDLLNGEELSKDDAVYIYIDGDKTNDNPDNHCWVSKKTDKMINKVQNEVKMEDNIELNELILISKHAFLRCTSFESQNRSKETLF